MSIQFKHLNSTWNAEPNAPNEEVKILGEGIVSLEFFVNPWAYQGYSEGQRIKLTFNQVVKYRLGETNDEGWYRGWCRFGKLAKKWGEFYQVLGFSKQVKEVTDWINLTKENDVSTNHYLFYLRDNTFECFANSFDFQIV